MFDKGFYQDLSYTGDKIGPGPYINVREVNRDAKPSSNKTTFSLERRHIGEPNKPPDHPGPSNYKQNFKYQNRNKYS